LVLDPPKGLKEKGKMTTPPPADYTLLAAELINSCTAKDFPAMARVLERLDPQRVDVALFIRGNHAHINFVGAFRSISFPRFPHLIAPPPRLERIAQVLAEVIREE
jgi:hypothetical protein